MSTDQKTVVWIAGAAGRMGQAIKKHLNEETYTVLATDVELDITDLKAVEEFARTNFPDVVINAAGKASQEAAEADPDAAFKVNALGARNLAIASANIGATIVHLSTDDLFPLNMPYALDEFDPTVPPHTYGRSKEAGEKLVRELNQRHIIVRSSWVYTDLPTDFVRTIISKADAGEEIGVANNQFAAPTSVDTYADFIIAAMSSDEFGTFHATCEGLCSRYEFAERILKNAGASTATLTGKLNPQDAYRIDLDNRMIRLTGVYAMPTWQEDLDAFMGRNGLSA